MEEGEEGKANSASKDENKKPAPFIYSAMFNDDTNVVMAGGAGANQVRLFDYDTGNVVCIISDLPKAVICMAKANSSNDFAFGSVDSKIRFITQQE